MGKRAVSNTALFGLRLETHKMHFYLKCHKNAPIYLSINSSSQYQSDASDLKTVLNCQI